MYPILLNLGPLTLHTYGFLVAIGFLLAMETIKRLAVIGKLPLEKTLDLAFWVLMVGFLGARVLYVIVSYSDFAGRPLDMFKIWEGGLVFFGGPIAVLPFLAWYVRKHHLSYWKLLDVYAPALAIGHCLGRLGCLAAGCCYGRPTGSSFGVRLYSEVVAPELRGALLHPTQVYESFCLLLLYGYLIFLYKRRSFDGQVIAVYFMIYAVLRTGIEMLRGDVIRGFIIEPILSTSQFLGIFIGLGGALIFFICRNHNKKGQSLNLFSNATVRSSLGAKQRKRPV